MIYRHVTRITQLAWLAALGIGAGAAVAGDVPDNATTAFFGKSDEWKNAALVAHGSNMLAGAREYYVSGSGEIVITDVTVGADGKVVELRYELAGMNGLVNTLFERLAVADVLETRPAELDYPPPTCGTNTVLILKGRSGQVRSIPFPRAKPTEAYEQAWLELAAIQELLKGAEPVYRGPYDRQFVPQGFEWSADAVVQHRPAGWPKMATEEEKARAEREYRIRAELQRREVERVRAEEMEAKKQD